MRVRVLSVLAAGALLAGLPAVVATGPPASAASASTSSVAASRPGGPLHSHRCDPLDPTDCLLPFPNDWFTEFDPHTPTKRRVDISYWATPRNRLGVPINPAPQNRADGFSPGSMLLVHVPGIDLAETGAAPITDIGASLDSDAPIVIIDSETGERWPYWAELDANATNPDRQALIIRPARNFREGHRYLVALRNLRDSDGDRIQPREPFARMLAGDVRGHDRLHERYRATRKVLRDLRRHGISRRDHLYLAWDFTVASQRSLAGPILHMRDEALAGLEGDSPTFRVTTVTDYTAEEDPEIAREVAGYVRVPSYLDLPGGPPGSALTYGEDGLPERLPGNVQMAQFQCEIPRTAFEEPATASLYGHGLLGSHTEVEAGNVQAMASEHNFVFCATKWIGMAEGDIPNVVSVFADFSRFHTITGRLQQSLLNFMFLGRGMIHPDGFVDREAFQTADGEPLIDISDGLAYDGNSQGGIIGGALVAVSPDVRNAVLGVPGMNYSTLLNRSVDFEPFQALLDSSYPDKLDQQIIFALLQMLWDRGEADGYAEHMTDDPLPNTPSHRVLLHVAFGDHQVAPVTAEVEARTIGARIHAPAVEPGRRPDVEPYWAIPAIESYPYTGSAIVIWDSGTPHPPLTNTPPSGPEYGRDPHEDPRHTPAARVQKARFLRTGQVVDVCGGAPCHAVRTD